MTREKLAGSLGFSSRRPRINEGRDAENDARRVKEFVEQERRRRMNREEREAILVEVSREWQHGLNMSAQLAAGAEEIWARAAEARSALLTDRIEALKATLASEHWLLKACKHLATVAISVKNIGDGRPGWYVDDATRRIIKAAIAEADPPEVPAETGAE